MTASALAEHAYCPRALYYHRTTDPDDIDPFARDRMMRGVRVHREFGTIEVRAQLHDRIAVALVVGLSLALAVLAVYGART